MSKLSSLKYTENEITQIVQFSIPFPGVDIQYFALFTLQYITLHKHIFLTLQPYGKKLFLCLSFYVLMDVPMFIHSFHWHVKNATIPCSSQELLPFLSVSLFPPLFSTNYSSILPHFTLRSIS
jgi:hypothetical protein